VIEALRKTLREHPAHADAHGQLGMLLLEQARDVLHAALSQRRRADDAARALYLEALAHFRAVDALLCQRAA
jgi:uncharacterized protein HemY